MSLRRFSADLTAGLTVSFAAISLGAAFGIMSGRGAFAGMIGAAVIPIIASIFGGTRIQASGPTAPMTAISALIIAYAYDSFADKAVAEQFITLVFLLNALMLVIAGLIGLGKFIRLIPNVVILGFMNGIAVLIWSDQFRKVLSLGADARHMGGGILPNILIAVITFGLIYLIGWTIKKLNVRASIRSFASGVLWSIIIMTIVVSIVQIQVEKITLGTSLESFSDFLATIVNYFPSVKIFTLDYILEAIPFALQLTLLAYLDSLLTALVIDRMTHEKSKLNKELFAQGLANAASSVMQGIPGAQATIRSVLLVKEGAQTRLAGVLIGLFALAGILILKDYLALVPAAVFTGVLLKVGLDVCDKDFIKNYFKQGWIKSKKRNIQLGFILYTTVVTVIINLNIAVLSGTVLYYLARYVWKIEDVDDDINKSEEEIKKSEVNNEEKEIIKKQRTKNKKLVIK